MSIPLHGERDGLIGQDSIHNQSAVRELAYLVTSRQAGVSCLGMLHVQLSIATPPFNLTCDLEPGDVLPARISGLANSGLSNVMYSVINKNSATHYADKNARTQSDLTS